MFAIMETGNEMNVVRPRVALVAAIAVGAVALTVVFAWTHSGGGTHAASRASKAAPSSCESRLLHDWSDGRIDGTYPVTCYRTALRSLPADLKVYSSAPDDISAALSQRIVQSHHAQKISGHQGAASVRKIASAP
jgi:hypothetical protein